MKQVKINFKAFGKMLSDKRKTDSLSFREAEKVHGVSAATLCRLETGSKPDVEHFATLCGWLGIDMNFFVKTK